MKISATTPRILPIVHFGGERKPSNWSCFLTGLKGSNSTDSEPRRNLGKEIVINSLVIFGGLAVILFGPNPDSKKKTPATQPNN